MTLTVRDQLKYWGAALVVFLFLLWWLGDVILPFVLGAAVAYLLDPIADRLQAVGLGRVVSVAIITVGMLLFFVACVVLVIPTLVSQAAALSERIALLIEQAPNTVASAHQWLTTEYPGLVDNLPEPDEIETTLGTLLQSVTAGLRERAGTLIEGAVASVSGLFNVLVLFLIVPVVSVYLLVDWDRMMAKIDSLLPRDHAPVIRSLAREVDDTLASFVRGQGLVCLILGVYYAAALALVGLQFGLIVGAIAGFLTFIPYVGALVGGVLAIGLALFQFWGDWVWIIAVWAIFQSGQFVEGNFLTPKLVGDSVGLHPVWLLFALAAFGSVFGFVGLLVAVPLAAAIGVIARFMTARYKASALYQGSGRGPQA
ncbi:Predicted PurR-regulated permease PerM [Palleronia marisminoris]|uniref:Pheromone autoinducer 2 transporter n=1 Tax=Palleronia marisminoris TaxID=315423 RepID=A0A1Y5TAH3_9RHOB|nr:AI-2E family transporter [Palleronia marisminoris]SFH21841.1 Predicted PurR-regulated permease PerM [Palleronia marisminoris]SLN57532.1 pheromone autoinducer 2 transporter [Palleronia marisminoris]